MVKWKMLLLIFSIIFSVSCVAQKVQFKCVLRSSCADSLTTLQSYFLKKDSFTFSSFELGPTITLPDTGVYVFITSQVKGYEGLSSQKQVHIADYGLKVDTLKKIDLDQAYFVGSKPPDISNGDWIYCGQLANGHLSDEYTNGNKWIEGSFKNGKPVGDLKFYTESGQLRLTEHYDNTGKRID